MGDFPYTAGTFNDTSEVNSCNTLDALCSDVKTNMDLIEYRTLDIPLGGCALAGNVALAPAYAGNHTYPALTFPVDFNDYMDAVFSIKIPDDMDITTEMTFYFTPMMAGGTDTGLTAKFTVYANYMQNETALAGVPWIALLQNVVGDNIARPSIQTVTLTGFAAKILSNDGVLTFKLHRRRIADGDDYAFTLPVIQMGIRYKRTFAS